MVFSARRSTLLFLTALLFAAPVWADNVTISGTVGFASIDGSSLDHDGAADGTFTVNDGDLTILGTVNCNDDVTTSACSMKFVVSGNFTMQPGSAIYAENRNGGGAGGNIVVTAGQKIVLRGKSATQAGAIISSSNLDTASGSAGGDISLTAGTSGLLEAGSIISAGAKGGAGGVVTVTAADPVEVSGLIASGPGSVLTTTRYTGAVLSGGSATATGGAITVVSHSHSEPAITITSSGTVVSQSGSGNSGHVALEGCGIVVDGLVASVSVSGPNAEVTLRSGTTIVVDGRDLVAGGTHTGMLRADALQQSAASYSANLYARGNITVVGPPVGALFTVTSNGGGTSKDASGSISLISTMGGISASGNAFAATNSDAGDQGGFITIAAAQDIRLDSAKIDASGDDLSGNSERAGGRIDVRSYSGSVTWQNGSGDVRPTGSASGISLTRQGAIAITYCASLNTNGTSFASNGTPNAPWPLVSQACAAVSPSLPAGETHPDCNDAPVVANDAYTLAEGDTLSVAAPGVLANDVDPDGDAMTAVLVSAPAHASSFTLNGDGSFTYVHDGTENHSDSFTYEATDGSATSTIATVSLTITPVNDAPTAVNDSYTVAEAGTINYAAPGVLANDTDVDGPAPTAVLVTAPAHAASFSLSADGSFIYVHDGSETTSDSFTYEANDGSLVSNVATVSIAVTPVNDAPAATGDAYTTSEGGTLNGGSVLANDSDAESDPLTAVLVTGPAHASSFTLHADGTFVYVHDGTETTSDSFTYKANDGSADSDVVTVVLTITPVNDSPVAVADTYEVAEGGMLVISAPGVLSNDTDAENDPTTSVLVSAPAHATAFTLNGNGSFTYTHDGSETTSDTFTYEANDGAADSNVVTVTITITPVNDAPAAVNDTVSVDEGGTLSGPSVLANDADAENDALTAALISGPAHAASFVLNADGTFTYVHDGSESASDTFTYEASDGSLTSNVATVTIAINPVNDAPAAVDDTLSVAEGGTLNSGAPGVLGNDTDAEHDALTAVLVSAPAHAASFTLNPNGSFTYVHDGSEVTSDSFTYKANDGSADSNVASVTIAITPVNDAPIAVADSYAVEEGGTLSGASVIANDSDEENNPLTAVLVTGPVHASSFTLNADGTFVYVHDAGEAASDAFTYKVSDGALESNVVTVTITITPVNDAPTAQNDGPYSVSSGTTLNVAAPGVLGNDTDVDSASLTAVLVNGPVNAAAFALNADGSFSYTSNGTVGADTFTYAASDGTAQSNIVSVTINVYSLPPVANDDAFVTVANTELRVGSGPVATPNVSVAGSVLDNDTDADTAHASLSIVSWDATSANGGSITMATDGTFTYYPPVLTNAPDTFHYIVTDGANTATGLVTVTFNGRVWYVRNDAGAGDGRSHSPLSSLTAAASLAQVNDTIFIHRGDGTATNHAAVTLQAGQRLIGEGVTLTAGPFVLYPAGLRPTIRGVTLGHGNTIAGVNIVSAGDGISGTAVNSGTIDSFGINGGTNGIVLSNVSGAFTISNGTIAPGAIGISLTGTANVASSNVDVTTAGSTGVIASGSGDLTFDGGSVSTTSGTAVNVSNRNLGGSGLISVNATNATDGIVLSNTTGTFTVTGTGAAGSGGTISGMLGRGVNVSNAAGLSLSSMNITSSGAQGLLVANTLSYPSAVAVQNSTFSGNFSNAIQTASGGTGLMNVSVGGSTFANNTSAVVVQTTAGPLHVSITNNHATYNSSTAFNVTRSATANAAVDVTISNNTVGTAGVAGSGAVCGGGCGAISVAALGGGAFNTLLDNNVIRQIDGIAIRARSGQGSGALNATISGNVIEEPVTGALNGINVQSGSLSADTNATCASIVGNSVTGGFATDVAVRNTSAGTSFSLPNYAGLGTDTTAVANFIIAGNTITTATATRKTTTPSNQFSGGAPCAVPAP